MKTKLRIWANAIIGVVLGFFGFGCSSCVMYGVPSGDLTFESQVSNETNEPLEGMQVVRCGGWKDDSGTTYWDEERADTLYTDAEGKVFKEYKDIFPLTYHRVTVNDPAGEYQSHSLIIEVRYKGGHGWYEGHATLDPKFVLHKQEE